MSRQAIEDELRSQGAIIQKSVSKQTDLVIALNKPSPQKIAEAKKLGIRIISIEDIGFDIFNNR